ncbi:MAG: hypothetical protein GQ557_01515, partial [Mycoplasmataceae bacterium]|nr:hypothetical protein [Mycoplasmataceae bacterium]
MVSLKNLSTKSLRSNLKSLSGSVRKNYKRASKLANKGLKTAKTVGGYVKPFKDPLIKIAKGVPGSQQIIRGVKGLKGVYDLGKTTYSVGKKLYKKG